MDACPALHSPAPTVLCLPVRAAPLPACRSCVQWEGAGYRVWAAAAQGVPQCRLRVPWPGLSGNRRSLRNTARRSRRRAAFAVSRRHIRYGCVPGSLGTRAEPRRCPSGSKPGTQARGPPASLHAVPLSDPRCPERLPAMDLARPEAMARSSGLRVESLRTLGSPLESGALLFNLGLAWRATNGPLLWRLPLILLCIVSIPFANLIGFLDSRIPVDQYSNPFGIGFLGIFRAKPDTIGIPAEHRPGSFPPPLASPPISPEPPWHSRYSSNPLSAARA
jgi:hypothetical protein